MNKNRIIVAIGMTMLVAIATGCQKEDLPNADTRIDVVAYYSLGEITRSVSLHSEAECVQFLNGIMEDIKAGASLQLEGDDTLWDDLDANNDPIIFETENERVAGEWAAAMLARGYDVDMTYDEVRQVFICIATPHRPTA